MLIFKNSFKKKHLQQRRNFAPTETAKTQQHLVSDRTTREFMKKSSKRKLCDTD